MNGTTTSNQAVTGSQIIITIGDSTITGMLRDGVITCNATGTFEAILSLPDGDDRKTRLETAIRALLDEVVEL